MKATFTQFLSFTRPCNYHSDVPWGFLNKWLENQKEINLNLEPDFQRGHVWTEFQQAKYVEFIIRGGTSGRDLYFNHPNWMGSFEGDYVIVDGLQRLTAVRKFLANELVIFNDFKFSDFIDKIPLDCNFKMHINKLKTKKEVLTWYLEMNSFGTPHSAEELKKVCNLMDEV